MRQEERDTLRHLYQFRCGYCGVTERDIGAELTVDHYQPRSQGGTHAPENWVYCCHPCNEFKGGYWQADPTRQLLHPLRDDLAAHLVERDDGTLRGLSPRGTNHIEILHLNRAQLAAHRRERRRLQHVRETQDRLLQRLQRFEKKVQVLTMKLERLKAQGGDA